MNVILYTLYTLGIMGFTAGGLLMLASKKLSVQVDTRVEELANVLPESNCGACGYASCMALAKALAAGEAAATSCIAGGSKVAGEVAEILGKPVDLTQITQQVAVVQCRGGKGTACERFEYTGLKDCSAALLVAGGHKACVYGCLGLGTCVVVCPFDAIKMGEDGIPIIDEDKCTACGKCVEVCPRNIITLIPREKEVYLACVSHDKLKKVRDICKVGCITCGICVKPNITPEELIAMGDENLPIVNWEKGKDLKNLLGEAIKKCPNKCFVIRAK